MAHIKGIMNDTEKNETERPWNGDSKIEIGKPLTSVNVPLGSTPATGSPGLSPTPDPGEFQLKNLSKDMGAHLLKLMKDVSTTVTPTTVASACQCAKELNKLMRFNLELYKIKKGK